MAVIETEFDSVTLKRTVSFKAIIPFERFQPPYPTLYLLHGLMGNSGRWLYNTNIKELAENMGIAVIMPSGENSFYLDIPVKNGCLGDFGAYIGQELVEATRALFPLSAKREDTFIAGMSMGGYGALRNGLKYHETFGRIAVFAGAVHFYEYTREWVYRDGNVAGELENFEPLDETEKTDRNPRVLIREIQALNQKDGQNHFPALYMTCGEQDALLGANRQLAMALKEAGADVIFAPAEGRHDAAFCARKLPDVLHWLGTNTVRR